MRNTYTITLIDRYSAEDRRLTVEAINEEHARKIAHNRATESEYVYEIIKAEPKTYTTTEGHDHQETTSAAQAMAWHREGRRVTVWGWRPDGRQYHVAIPGAVQEKRTDDQENRDTCRRIAQEADAYAAGQIIRCPECGECWHLPDDVGDKYRCPECGTVADIEDYEVLSIWDFLEDCYDIEYRIGSDKKLRSVQIMVACGGPNIYLDTASKDVELYWWGDRARYPLSYDTVEAIDAWAEELYQC